MNTERLIDLYRKVISTAGWVADDEGYVSVDDAGVMMPCLIGKKEERLVLPVQHQLEKVDKSKITFFHVLDEHVSQPETEVFKSFRHAIAEKLKTTILVAAIELLTISASKDRQKKLTPKQSEVLSVLAHADDKTITTFMSLMEAIDESPKERGVVSIYLSRGGKLADHTHQRVSVVFFPLYEALVKDGIEREKKMEERKKLDKEQREDIPNVTYGVKLRPKDRQIYIGLFEYIIPDIAEKDAYSAASNAAVGPSTDALMASVKKLVHAINTVINRFKSITPSLKHMLIPEDWVEAFDDISSYAVDVRKIPTQKGGRHGTEESKSTAPVEGGVYQSRGREELPSIEEDRQRRTEEPRGSTNRNEPQERRMSLSDLQLQQPLGYQQHQPYGGGPLYERQDRRDEYRGRGETGRSISPSEAVSGMLGGYYENNYRAPLSSNQRPVRSGGGGRHRY